MKALVVFPGPVGVGVSPIVAMTDASGASFFVAYLESLSSMTISRT